jgi:cobalt/nickel transport system ATP-binding protein
MDEVIFRLEQVAYSYLGKFSALSGVNFAVKRGEMISVIGANGSGKSTLLHLLDGLVYPDKGRFFFEGVQRGEKDFTEHPFARDFRKKVGLVFQNPDVQLFCPTVREDIVFGPLQFGTEKKEIDKRLEKVLAMLGIEKLLERAPHQLSVGEKRKVAIASTLMIDPDVLILDEPTAGLDPLTTRHIIDLLLDAHEAGKTVITSTHDLHVAQEISDTMYVFSQEKTIVASGAPDAILDNGALLQAHNLIHVHAHTHDGTVHAHPHRHWDHHDG